jgi:hypothetical protein
LGSSVTQVALEDLRTALINLDRMVCAHLRTSHGYVFRSLTRDSQLSEEETQSANDPSYAEMPAVLLKHATGRCSDPYCDTTYRLNWTFGLESIQLGFRRKVRRLELCLTGDHADMMRCRSCWQSLSLHALVIWKSADILRLFADAGHETRFDQFVYAHHAVCHS